MSFKAAPLNKAHATNSSATSFAAKVATVTEPAGTGVINVQGADTVELMPYGTGADDTTFDMRVIGWRALRGTWVPTQICTISCTLSTAVGDGGGQLTTSERFADTITVGSGIAVAPSVAANTPALVSIDSSGFEYVEMIFDMTGATDANALVAAF